MGLQAKRRDRVGLRIDSSRAPVPHYTADGRLLHVDYYAKIAFGDVVQQYDTGAEFRPGDEVCDPESVASWKGLTFVDEHPEDGVDADNAAALNRGHVLDAWAEYPDVAATIRAIDRRTIDRIDSGKQKLSCGYDVQCDEVPGEFNGVPYVRRQKNIRGNHVALTYAPRGERDGDNPRIYMDSTGAHVGVQKDESEIMKKIIIKLPDGTEKEIEVPEDIAAAIEAMQAKCAEMDAGGEGDDAGGDAGAGGGAPAAAAAPAGDGQSQAPGAPPKMDSKALERLVDARLEQRLAAERERARKDSIAYTDFRREADAVLSKAGKSVSFSGDLVSDRITFAEQVLGADDGDVKAARIAQKRRSDSTEAASELSGLALGLYRAALAEHRRRNDSTGQQLAGLTVRTDSIGDDDVLASVTKQFGGKAAN